MTRSKALEAASNRNVTGPQESRVVCQNETRGRRAKRNGVGRTSRERSQLIGVNSGKRGPVNER